MLNIMLGSPRELPEYNVYERRDLSHEEFNACQVPMQEWIRRVVLSDQR